MTEGRINWLGADGKYRTEDTGDVGDPGDFVLAEDRDGNTVLLEWDATAGEWVFGGPVNLDESDVTGIGTMDSVTVDTTAVLNADYNETVERHASASGTVTLDLSAANIHVVEAIDNVTVEVENVTADPAGNSTLVQFEDDDDGGPYTISWGDSWNTLRWASGDEVAEIPGEGSVRVGLTSFDGGDQWDALESAANFEEVA